MVAYCPFTGQLLFLRPRNFGISSRSPLVAFLLHFVLPVNCQLSLGNISLNVLLLFVGYEHLSCRKGEFFPFSQENLENIYNVQRSVVQRFLRELFKREFTQEDFLAWLGSNK